MKICFVTPDILGPIKNGGVGTATAQLAALAAELGHEVTVLFTIDQKWLAEDISVWQRTYNESGIRLLLLEQVQSELAYLKFWPASDDIKVSFLVREYLSQTAFDAVFFCDWLGHAALTAIDKKNGLGFGNVELLTLSHGTQLWAFEGMDFPIRTVDELVTIWLERMAIAHSNTLICLNEYMVEWLKTRSFEIPSDVQILRLPYDPDSQLISVIRREAAKKERRSFINSEPARTGDAVAAPDPGGRPDGSKSFGISFFGRLEARKGLDLFCFTLDRLSRVLGPSGPSDLPRLHQVNFIGKFGSVDGIDAFSYIMARSKTWPFQINLHPNFGQVEALEYLDANRTIVVVPSESDNSPLVVIEALRHRHCVAVARTGGIPALMDAAYHQSHVFDFHPKSLADLIISLAKADLPVPAASYEMDTARDQWKRLFTSLDGQARSAASRPAPRPGENRKATDTVGPADVTVVLLHRNRHNLVQQALIGLRQQEAIGFGLVVVDDGSDDPETIEVLPQIEREVGRLGGKMIYLDDVWLGAARNHAVKDINTKYILFMDDDNVAMPHEVSRLLEVAERTQADFVTCASIHFEGDQSPNGMQTASAIQVPLGACYPLSALNNYVGDANFLVRREVFQQLGGFREYVGVGSEDWEILMRAEANGYKIVPVFTPLYFKRLNKDPAVNRMRRQASFVRPMLEGRGLAHGAAAYDAVNLMHGLRFEPDYKWFAKEWYAKHMDIPNFVAGRFSRDVGRTSPAVREIALDAFYGGLFENVRLSPDVATFLQRDIASFALLARGFAGMRQFEEADCFQLLSQFLLREIADQEGRSSIRAVEALVRLNAISISNTELFSNEYILLLAKSLSTNLFAQMPVWFSTLSAISAAFRGELWLACAICAQASAHLDSLYLVRHPDVVDAVKTGFVASGLDHYLRFGRRENRLLSPMPVITSLLPEELTIALSVEIRGMADRLRVDEAATHKIVDSIGKSDDISFLDTGRLLYNTLEAEYADRRPDVSSGIPKFFASCFEHYLLYGRGENSENETQTNTTGASLSKRLNTKFWAQVGLPRKVDRSGWSGPRWVDALKIFS